MNNIRHDKTLIHALIDARITNAHTRKTRCVDCGTFIDSVPREIYVCHVSCREVAGPVVKLESRWCAACGGRRVDVLVIALGITPRASGEGELEVRQARGDDFAMVGDIAGRGLAESSWWRPKVQLHVSTGGRADQLPLECLVWTSVCPSSWLWRLVIGPRQVV